MLRKALALTAVVFSFAFSCCDEDDGNEMELHAACSVNNPVADLAWLKSMIAEMCGSADSEYGFIDVVSYKGADAFMSGSGCPYCNTVSILYDCTGAEIGVVDVTDGHGNAPEGHIPAGELTNHRPIHRGEICQ
jgi:hypothetical protein